MHCGLVSVGYRMRDEIQSTVTCTRCIWYDSPCAVCVCVCVCSLTPTHLPLTVHLCDLRSEVLLLTLPLNTQGHQVRLLHMQY